MNLEAIFLTFIAIVVLVTWISMRRMDRLIPPPVTRETPLGRFRRAADAKSGSPWSMDFYEIGNGVGIQVPDLDDSPDPSYLARIPGLAKIVKKSDAVARTALREYFEDTDPHPIFDLSDVILENAVGFTLHYATDEEQGHDFSAFVSIEDGKVTDILVVD